MQSRPAVHLIQMPYRGERGSPECSAGPAALDDERLRAALGGAGLDVAPPVTVTLTDEEERQYGAWQRVALANRHLGDAVAAALDSGALPVGLLANCNALPGMLGGLQRARARAGTRGRGDDTPRIIGLIWIDAHADFNTPETTLSGMLGGMPVAISAGLCLHRLRTTAGLDPPLLPANIVMAGLRDVDLLERALLDEHGIVEVPGEAMNTPHDDLPSEFARLPERTDTIYVHVDMDVLDPAEVRGHPLTVPGGPSSEALASFLARLFCFPEVAALGIASTPPPEHDPEGTARAAAHRLISAAATAWSANCVR